MSNLHAEVRDWIDHPTARSPQAAVELLTRLETILKVRETTIATLTDRLGVMREAARRGVFVRQGNAGLWFATLETGEPIFVGQHSYDALLTVLGEVFARSQAPIRSDQS